MSTTAAADLLADSANSSLGIGFNPSAEVVPAPTVFVLIVSGVRNDLATTHLRPAFQVSSNPLCAADAQSLCEEFAVQAEVPTTSLPNWLALLSGTSPPTHGVLGNVALKPWPFDTVFGQAERHGVHAGVSASPWLVNPIKAALPLLDGDGRVSSSANGFYETTSSASTASLDTARFAATSAAIVANKASSTNRQQEAPSKYALFLTQLTNVDSVGHRRGTGDEYTSAMANVGSRLIELMGELPPHSVLLVTSDHGHEEGGGAGGVAPGVRTVPLFVYRKTVEFGASDAELALL
eukprot:5705708-Prymnesium_polylepis.1